MSLTSHQLDAFFMVVKMRSFTKAARALHIGQPALSTRIKLLEEEFGVTLLERGTEGLRPTEAGFEVLKYCQQREQSESSLIQKLKSNTDELNGFLRIAGSSTIMSFVTVHAMSSLLQKNPSLQMEFQVRQNWELSDILLRGQSDFVIMDHPLRRQGTLSLPLGFEQYAIFESKIKCFKPEVYFDTFEDDRVTENYFTFQEKQGFKINPFKREFSGDVFVMLEAVKSGLGRAVLPLHLISEKLELKRINNEFAIYQEPLFLNYIKQELPTALFKQVLEAFETNGKKLLKN